MSQSLLQDTIIINIIIGHGHISEHLYTTKNIPQEQEDLEFNFLNFDSEKNGPTRIATTDIDLLLTPITRTIARPQVG